MQNDMQRERVVNYLKGYEYYPCIEEGDDDDAPEFRKYVFMTTVAMSAFEQDKITVSHINFMCAVGGDKEKKVLTFIEFTVATYGSCWR